MNLLVTGPCGYIGSTLVPYLLSRGHHVRALDSLSHGGEGLLNVWSHPNLEIVPGDIRDQDLCISSLRHVDAVIHLAAIVGAPACDANPDDALEVNHIAAARLAYDARLSKVPLFLFASTASVYGSVPQGQSCNEESERVPLSLYAQTKIDAEDAILGVARLGAFLPIVLRFGTAYGISQRMRFDTLINQFAKEATQDGKLLVYQADAMRPYCHVRDIARAIDFVVAWASAIQRRGVAGAAYPSIFNVGGHNRSKRDLAEWLKSGVKDLEVEYVSRPDLDPRDYAVDFANGNLARIGWAPSHCPETGMLEVVEALEAGAFLDPEEGRWRNV